MNKLFLAVSIIAGLAVFGLTGCSKSETGGGATIDTAKVQSAFATASAVDKAEVEKAVTAVKAGDYATALTSLKQAAASVNLTPEQQQSLKDLLAQVQTKLSAGVGEAVSKAKDAAADAASKATSEVPKPATK
jgi:hypothetical protein